MSTAERHVPPGDDGERERVGTVANVEGRIAVLIGTEGGPVHWQWLNGDWTAIPLSVDVLGHVTNLVPSRTGDDLRARIAAVLAEHEPAGFSCSCGWENRTATYATAHRAHVADALADTHEEAGRG